MKNSGVNGVEPDKSGFNGVEQEKKAALTALNRKRSGFKGV